MELLTTGCRRAAQRNGSYDSNTGTIPPRASAPPKRLTAEMMFAEEVDEGVSVQTTDLIPQTTSPTYSTAWPPHPQGTEEAVAAGKQHLYQHLAPGSIPNAGNSHPLYQPLCKTEETEILGLDLNSNVEAPKPNSARVWTTPSQGSHEYASIPGNENIMIMRSRRKQNPLYDAPSFYRPPKKSRPMRWPLCLLCVGFIMAAAMASASLAIVLSTAWKIPEAEKGSTDLHAMIQLLQENMNNTVHKLNCDFADSVLVTVGLSQISTDWVPESPGPNTMVIFASCSTTTWTSHLLEQQNYSQADGPYKQYRCTCSGYFSKAKKSSCVIRYWKCSVFRQTL